MITDYFEDHEFYVENIRFRVEGIVYRGNGMLRWTTGKGFRLVAQVNGDSFPVKKEFRSIDFKKPIRMNLTINSSGSGMNAITPFLYISDWDLLFGKPYKIDFRHIVFFEKPHNRQSPTEMWSGSGMYETEQRLIFPNIVRKEVLLEEEILRRSSSSTGFNYSIDNGEQITGEIRNEKYLYFDWALPKKSWTKQQSWHFAEALRDALSIITGNVVCLRYHETYRNHQLAKEYSTVNNPSSLGLIFRPLDFDIVNKNLVAHLAFFLSHESEKERIVRKIFWQLVDVSNQKSQGATELLLSTILEATLRTLYNIPFVPGRPVQEDPFKSQKTLEQFQREYLAETNSAEWEKIINKVDEAYKRLRHRNAHPDWLSTPSGMLSIPEKELTTNDMILLSRFYGYMILALSGKKGLVPKFPAPISKWGPIMTMEINQSQ